MECKKLFFAVVVLCASAFAQNNLVPVPPVFLGPATAPRLGANLTITFCTSTATGAPCSSLAQAYADSTNSNPINQTTTPLKTDALGNAPVFYAAPGQYSFTVTGPGIGTPQGPYQITVSCIPGTTCVATGTALAQLSYNTRQMCDQFTGADASVKINACIAAVIALGGGIADATGFHGAQTISQEIDVGNDTPVPVTLLLGNQGATFSVTINNAAKCGIKLFDYAYVDGGGVGGSSRTLIVPSTTSPPTVDSLVCTEAVPPFGANYIVLKGLGIENLTGVGTYTNGLLHVQDLFDESRIDTVAVHDYQTGTGVVVEGACCGVTFSNFQTSNNSTAGNQPLLIRNPSGDTNNNIGLVFQDASIGRPGAGQPNIKINCATPGACYGITFANTLYMEPNTTDTSTALVQIISASGVTFQTVEVGGTIAGGSNTAYVFDLASGGFIHSFGVDQISITGNTGNIKNFINNHINSTTIASSTTFGTLNGYRFTDSVSFSVEPSIAVNSGTVCTAPSYTFIAETGLGWLRSASGTISACSGGTQVLDILSNGIKVRDGSSVQLGTLGDTALSRVGPKVMAVGTGGGNTSGYVKTAQTLQVISNNYTTTGTTLAGAGVVTGLQFTAPASVLTNWSFQCNLIYSQATAAAANLFGITTTQAAPTNLQAWGAVYTNNTGTVVQNNALITSATSTTIVTATPSAFGAIGTNADMFEAYIKGTVEVPNNASPTQVGISVATGNASDALTIYRGSSCWFY